MTVQDKTEAALRLALLPAVEWEATVDALSTEDRFEYERTIATAAERYARASAYLSRRMSGGKHEDAVKAQNKAAARVRQALGYTYAESPITF